MNKHTIATILLLTATSSVASPFIAKDKQKHLAAEFIIGAGLEYYYEDNSYLKNVALCSSVGVVKEIYDELDYGGFDTKDLAYDVVGCMLGTLTVDYGLYLYSDDNTNGIGYKVKF